MTPDTPAHPPSASGHRLWWKPGGRGRGILFKSGLVHTWPEHEQKHQEVACCHPSETPRMFFYIRADGTVRIPRRHARHMAQISRALLAADRRLRPLCPISETTAPPPGVAAHGHRPNPRRWTAGLARNDRIKALY